MYALSLSSKKAQKPFTLILVTDQAQSDKGQARHSPTLTLTFVQSRLAHALTLVRLSHAFALLKSADKHGMELLLGLLVHRKPMPYITLSHITQE